MHYHAAQALLGQTLLHIVTSVVVFTMFVAMLAAHFVLDVGLIQWVQVVQTPIVLLGVLATLGLAIWHAFDALKGRWSVFPGAADFAEALSGAYEE